MIMRFDNRVYTLLAVKKAAYRYIDKFSADIRVENQKIICLLKFDPSLDTSRCAQLADDFRKEALDQDLREQIRRETEPIRNLIFAHAFSKTGMVGDEQIPRH